MIKTFATTYSENNQQYENSIKLLYCGFNIFKRNLKEIAASKRAVNSLALMPSLRRDVTFSYKLCGEEGERS